MKFFTASVLVLCASTFSFNSYAETEGEKIFNRECAACHADNKEATGTMQLARTRGADKSVLTERTDLSADYIRYVVRHGLGAMPPFTPVGLTEDELISLTNHLTN